MVQNTTTARGSTLLPVRMVAMSPVSMMKIGAAPEARR
jgi:hypothetical protein